MSDLAPEWRIGDVILTEPPFMVPEDAVDYGAPGSVTDLVQAVLAGGDRTVTLPFLIEEADFAAHAAAEALVAAECRKVRNEVYCDPGDGWGDPFVFDVFPEPASLVYTRDEKYEKNGYRLYTLTLDAIPYPRSATEVTLTPTPTSIGTARQQMHSITVDGSAQTEAAIKVEHASASLGDALVYSFPDSDYSPPLRQYASAATAAAATTDATTVSGARNMLDSAAHFDIPGDEILPGAHILIGRARTSTAGSATVEVTVGSYIGSPSGGSPEAEDSWEAEVNTAADGSTPTAYYTMLLTPQPFMLPQVTVGDPAFVTTRVTIVDADTSGIDVDLDQVWLLNLTSGALTWVWCGSSAAAAGGPANRLFIEPPTIDYPQPRLLIGTEADMGDAYGPGTNAESWMRHILTPGDHKVLTVTTNTTSAVTTVRHPKRWHTHAGS